MKIFYCGCKPIMRAERMSFTRSNKGSDVTEQVGTKLLKIDGFFPAMNDDAKKELAFNTKREQLEKEKINSGVTVVTVQDDSLIDEIESLKSQLEEAVNGSQLGSLMTENAALAKQLIKVKTALKASDAKLKALELTSKSNTAPSVVAAG